jgi:hypothetical protein
MCRFADVQITDVQITDIECADFKRKENRTAI